MEPLLEGLLRSLGGCSEANFLEVSFGRIPSGNFHTKATSKKSRPPSGNFRPNPPELPRSLSRSFSSHEAGWKNIFKNLGIVQKVFSEKASEIRQNGSCFVGKRGTFQNASEIFHASKMCGTPLGENTFWTVPKTPPRPEIQKKTKSSSLGWAPKTRKKYRKNTKEGHFRAIFVFFPGPNPAGGSCNFP